MRKMNPPPGLLRADRARETARAAADHLAQSRRTATFSERKQRLRSRTAASCTARFIVGTYACSKQAVHAQAEVLGCSSRKEHALIRVSATVPVHPDAHAQSLRNTLHANSGNWRTTRSNSVESRDGSTATFPPELTHL